MEPSKPLTFCAQCGHNLPAVPAPEACAGCGRRCVVGMRLRDLTRDITMPVDASQVLARGSAGAQKAAVPPPLVEQQRRPVSMVLMCLITLGFFGSAYVVPFGEIAERAKGGFDYFGRLFREPSEQAGGMAWPGWSGLLGSLRGDEGALPLAVGTYWWAKGKVLVGMFALPLLVVGWMGLLMGRRWGRSWVALYLAIWFAGGALAMAMIGLHEELLFGVGLGLAVYLLWWLDTNSWKEWIEQ